MSCHKYRTEESNLKPLDSTLWCSTAGDSECFLCLTLMTRWTTSFFVSLLSSKFTISLISIYKHYSIDIADPSRYAGSVLYELRNRPHSLWSLCGSVVEHRGAAFEGLRFNSTSFFISLASSKFTTSLISIYVQHCLNQIFDSKFSSVIHTVRLIASTLVVKLKLIAGSDSFVNPLTSIVSKIEFLLTISIR